MEPVDLDEHLTTHFTWREALVTTHRDCIPFQLAIPPTFRENAVRMCLLMETARTLLGGRAIAVHSLYRSPALNAAVGGATRSQHLSAEACDFHVAGRGLEDAFGVLVAGLVPMSWGQLILEGRKGLPPSWIHLSLPDVPRRLVGQVLRITDA
jgi:hypothetical protein